MKFLIISLTFLCLIFVSSNSILATCQTHCSACNQCTAAECNTCSYCSTNCNTSGGNPLGQIGGDDPSFGPWGGLGSNTSVNTAAGFFTKIISNVIGVMTIVAGIWFMFQFIAGGYAYMTAGEEPQKMGNATKKLTSSLIGLVVIVAAYAIISLLGSLLGFDILKPASLIQLLGP